MAAISIVKDIIGLVDSNNNIVVKYYYNAYGRIINKVDTSGINLSDINPFRYGLGNQKSKLAKYTVFNKVISSKETSELSKYTPSTEIQTAYIDPTYAIFKERSVYVDTEKPISVKPYTKKEK